MSNIKLNINLDEKLITKNSQDLVVSNKAEDFFLQILQAEELIKTAKANLTASFVEQADKEFPEWSGISGAKIKVTRSAAGAKYVAEDMEKLDDTFIKTEKKLDSKKVEAHFTLNGALPEGVEPNQKRSKSIRFTVKK